MKPSITSVQLAILDMKQARTVGLCKEMDAIAGQVAEVLGIEERERVRLEEPITTFLMGNHTTTELLDLLGVQVAR